METDLIEPEVWIEYLRLKDGVYVSGMNGIAPKDVTIRIVGNYNTGEQVREYLM